MAGYAILVVKERKSGYWTGKFTPGQCDPVVSAEAEHAMIIDKAVGPWDTAEDYAAFLANLITMRRGYTWKLLRLE